MSGEVQVELSINQIEAFYHDQFVDDQVRDFITLSSSAPITGVIVDIGGGVGHFAHRLTAQLGLRTRVIDMDIVSITRCNSRGVEAVQGNALAPKFVGDESVVCFNLILHHLVAKNEVATRKLQVDALNVWHGKATFLFVNEYIYETYLRNLSGRLIYAITSSRALSAVCSFVARVIPAFNANTFGIGVRFRAHQEWHELFSEAGYVVTDFCHGIPEPISPPLRSLLIKTIRRDSFRLEARNLDM
jgi:hypothetical protein